MLAEAHFLLPADATAFDPQQRGRDLYGRYAFNLPDDLDPTPEVYGVVTSDAPRNLTYRPFSLEPDPASQPMLEHAFDTRSRGMSVSVYRSREERSTRVAYWTLPGGYLQTFTDDRFRCGIDTDAAMRAVIADISVTVSTSGLPLVALHGPLHPGNPRDPDQRESIVFTPRDRCRTWPVVQVFREPTWVSRGRSQWDLVDWAARAETNELNLTIEVQGPRDQGDRLGRHARNVAASATPIA